MYVMIWFLFLCLSVLPVFSLDIQLDPIVQLTYGKVRGHVLKSTKNRPYYSFQDVPFAKAAVGDLRFKEAKPPVSWDDVKNTTRNTKKCQMFPRSSSTPREDAPEESEDCFYTNIYTPQLPDNSSRELLPVFFVIFGGGFSSGNGDFNFISPVEFMNYDLIVVVPNHRFGPLGFLYNNDDVFPGNLGLRDLNYALKWTYKNIAKFGGDPKKITLGGISSGAGAASALLIKNKSTGLIRGAILQSGTMLCQWNIQKYFVYYIHELAMKINSTININSTSNEILEVLKNAPLEELVKVNTQITIPHGMENKPGYYTSSGPWLPVVENQSSKDPFISEPPLLSLRNGNFNNVPIIIGYTSEEEITANTPSFRRQQSKLLDNDTKWVVNDLFNIPEEIKRIAGAEIRSIYTNKTFVEDPAAMIKFHSEIVYKHPVIRHAELQSKYTDVYLYQLSHKGPLGFQNGSVEVPGPNTVGHAEDESIQYGRRTLDKNKYPTSDIASRKRIVRMWSNFIIHLDPTPQQDPLLQGVKWPKFNQNEHKYLNFNTTLNIDDSGFEKYLKWKAIMEKYENY